MIRPQPTCHTIQVCAFRGDRSRAFAATFLKALDSEKHGGSGPSILESLLFFGHCGVSLNGSTIYGFHPDGNSLPLWQLLDRLKSGEAFPGVIRDDTSIFALARKRQLTIQSFELLVPPAVLLAFKAKLDAERQSSQYAYGFPNGDGDCNCITWLERLGLPLLTGRMSELINLPAIAAYPKRRFGECV